MNTVLLVVKIYQVNVFKVFCLFFKRGFFNLICCIFYFFFIEIEQNTHNLIVLKITYKKQK
ncbi:hypothetical protein F546_10950 [Vibrio paracholerae 877-163]|nr:hypothetical protein F546_10950 [Vibrio paracholerae 877-163]